MRHSRDAAEDRASEESVRGGSAGGFFLLGALVGASIGALVGLLYAPRPGTETRQEWERKSEDLRRRAEEAADKAAKRAEEFAERARQYAAKAEKAATLHRATSAGMAPETTAPDTPSGASV